MSGLLDEEILHQCRIGLSHLVMMGLYSHGFLAYHRARTILITDIRKPTDLCPSFRGDGRDYSQDLRANDFQNVNSLMPSREQ